MSVVQEFEGKTIEDAIQKACDRLNVVRDALTYEIITHGSSGIFGIVGVRKARIRVKHAPGDARLDSVPEAAPAAVGRVDQKKTDAGETPAAENVSRAEDGAAGEQSPDAAVLDLGRQALQKMVDAITSDASIDGHLNGDHILFRIQGGNAAILIGKHGQTLEAIQYLVEKIVNRRAESRVHLQIDVGGYLENRRKNLRSLARRMAAKAKKNGKPVTIGQLKPQERRIVHLELKEDQNLRTQSVGDGFVRKLIIIPRKKNRPETPRKTAR